MWDNKFKISNYRTATRGTITLAYECVQKVREIRVRWVLLYFTYLKVKIFMIKTCMIWFCKLDYILWLNVWYVLNMSWIMKNYYFRKLYFIWHMVRTILRPLGKKNIVKVDHNQIMGDIILHTILGLLPNYVWSLNENCLASVNQIPFWNLDKDQE